MASGVKCSDECLSKFNDLKLKKTCRYIIYKIKDLKEIIIEEEGDRACKFEDFKEKLDAKEPCYAVLDFEADDGRSDLILISWIPDTAPIRQKMVYASSMDALKSQLTGYKAFLQLNDKCDVNEEYFCSCLRK